MFKKLTWIYLAIYAAVMIFITVSSAVQSEEVDFLQAIFGTLIFLLPALPVALEVSGRKVHFIFTWIAFLFVAVMFLGTVKFNSLELRIVLQALLFAVMLGLLGYFGVCRLFRKKPVTEK